MTVCIAAMCTETMPNGTVVNFVVGASDRKYTAGNFTYEPYQTKWFSFSNDIVALIAGDAAENLAICRAVFPRVGPVVLGQTLISDIARAHASAFAEYRRQQAETWLLAPLGLSLATLGGEPRERVERIEDELRRWRLDDAVIITGVDGEGAHIWRVDDPGEATCHDSIGFAAIGSGATHAAAVFMRAKFERSWSIGRAALLTYQAKKAAEVDPYVGHETDMFVLGYGSDYAPGINVDLLAKLEEVHSGLIRDELQVRAVADEGIEDYVEKNIREPQRRQALQQGGDEAQPDESGVHDSAQEGQPQD
jgi:hypothetical protein